MGPLTNQSTNSWGGGQNQMSESSEYGSFHCRKFKLGKKCNLCSHMVETGWDQGTSIQN